MSIINELVFNRRGGEYYNAADLNRVGQAVSYLAARLNGYGHAVSVVAKQDWVMEDEPTAAQLQAYLNDVAVIREALAVSQTTPPTPEDMAGLTWQEANDIEKILIDVELTIEKLSASLRYSGAFYAGDYALMGVI